MMKQEHGRFTEQYGRVAGFLQKNVCFAGREAEIVSSYEGKTMPSRTDSTGSRVGTDAALNVPSADQFKFTTCYMCACRCGIRVHLRDGRIRYIEGNPDHPVNKRRALRQGRGRASCSTTRRRGCASRCCRVGERGSGEFERDRVGRGAGDSPRLAGADPRDRSEEARLLHRPRPEAGADRLVGAPVRHAQLRRARRLLLGQHGGRRASTRSAAASGSSASPTGSTRSYFLMFGVAEDHDSQPDQDRPRQAQGARRPRSSRSTRCAPATRRSPTSGSASAPAPTGCSCWR